MRLEYGKLKQQTGIMNSEHLGKDPAGIMIISLITSIAVIIIIMITIIIIIVTILILLLILLLLLG